MLKKTTLALLSIILLVSFSLISYQSKRDMNFPQIYPLQLISPIKYLQNLIDDFFILRKENRLLKEQLHEIILEKRNYDDLINENKRLKSLLGLKDYKKEIIAFANVISRGSNKHLKTLWIDRGSKDGIISGMPVIGINGLVGKIISTKSDFSEVLIITDPNFSVATRIERTRAEGILSGDGNRCTLKYIPLEEEVLVGDRVLTSGLDGIFPEGILIGFVKSANKKDGMFQSIEIIPAQSINKTEEVAILKNLK